MVPRSRSAFSTCLTFFCAFFVSPASSWSTSTTWLKEAEKKHARVALLALPTLVALQQGGVDDPVSFLSDQTLSTQLNFFAASGILEAGATLPRLTGFFQLRPGLEAGNVLGLETTDDELARALDRTETGLGRLAMICSFAWIASSVFVQ